MKNHRPAVLIAFTILSIVAFASLFRILTKGLEERVIDFHSYWYAGHFIWQGDDPYRACLQHQVPHLPVRYLDGPVTTQGPISRFAGAMPANTAPVVLITALLSRFSWPTAVTAWTVISLFLIVIIVWLVMRLLHSNFLSLQGALLLLLIFSLIATREALETGQTTILILAFMLAALVLGPRHPVAAGIFLGLALSKYSLAFPGFLYFAYKRWYRGLIVCLVIQLIGILAVAAIGNTTPQTIVAEYVQILMLHTDLPGYHLAAGILRGFPYTNVILGLGSTGLFVVLAYWHWMRRAADLRANELTDIVLLVIVMLWNLLTFYHRRYDHVADILFIGLIILWVQGARDKFDLSSRQRTFILIFLALSCCVWVLPFYLLNMTLYVALFNLCSIAALGVSVWLLFRVSPGMPPRTLQST